MKVAPPSRHPTVASVPFPLPVRSDSFPAPPHPTRSARPHRLATPPRSAASYSPRRFRPHRAAEEEEAEGRRLRHRRAGQPRKDGAASDGAAPAIAPVPSTSLVSEPASCARHCSYSVRIVGRRAGQLRLPLPLRRDGRRAGRPAVPAIAPTLLGSSACLRDHEPETCLFVSAALVFRGGNTAKPALDWRCCRRRRCGRWTSRRPFQDPSVSASLATDHDQIRWRGRSSPATAHAFGGGTCPKSVLAGPFRRRRRRCVRPARGRPPAPLNS